MKKLFFFAATMLAAATMSLNAQVWHAVSDDAAVEVKDADGNVTTQGAVIAAKGDPVQVGADVFGDKVQVFLQDGGADWVARGSREDGSFTGLDGVTYNKVYAQGGTNGMKGGIDKNGAVSAHVEIVPAVAGTVHIAAKYGYKKSIWAAKVPEAEVEDLVYTEMYKYAIDGFSTLNPGADTTLMYIKADGSGMMVGQDPDATADVFTTLALEVEPGYTYFFWVEGSKVMLCGINFVAGEAPSVPQMQLHGSWVENWGGPVMDIAADNATASAIVTLAAGDYEFGVKELDETGAQASWWSTTAGDTFTREANSVVFVKGGSKNAKLTADVAGDYKFVFTYATSTLAIEFPAAEGLFNATEAVKATKVIENGQVVIIRGDVRYNALGTVIE